MQTKSNIFDRLLATALKDAFAAIRSDSRILLIGSMAALFEGAMYTFGTKTFTDTRLRERVSERHPLVFLWTPMLQKADQPQLPFGVIFAILMISCAGGSSVFSLLSKTMEPATIAGGVFAVSAVALAVPMFTSSPPLLMVAFAAFEGCVGVYWPVIGTLKGIYVPEAQRSAIYNVFRVPLNAIVLVVLLFLSDINNNVACLSCAGLMVIGLLLQRKFLTVMGQPENNSASSEETVAMIERGENSNDASLKGSEETSPLDELAAGLSSRARVD